MPVQIRTIVDCSFSSTPTKTHCSISKPSDLNYDLHSTYTELIYISISGNKLLKRVKANKASVTFTCTFTKQAAQTVTSEKILLPNFNHYSWDNLQYSFKSVTRLPHAWTILTRRYYQHITSLIIDRLKYVSHYWVQSSQDI